MYGCFFYVVATRSFGVRDAFPVFFKSELKLTVEAAQEADVPGAGFSGSWRGKEPGGRGGKGGAFWTHCCRREPFPPAPLEPSNRLPFSKRCPSTLGCRHASLTVCCWHP